VAGGGTEMQGPLHAAMTSPRDERWLRQLVFITDGAVSYEDRLLQQIEDHLGDARLHTVGIGAAPNSYFMRKAAEFGGGSYSTINSPSEVASSMLALDRRLSAPTVTDLSISSNLATPLETYPSQVSTLFANDSLVMLLRTETMPEVLNIEGRTPTGLWEREIDTRALLASGQRTGVATLWARARIEDLMDQKIGSTSAESAVLVEEATQLALTHSIMSPYTSFVAVDERVTRFPGEIGQAKTVANALPSRVAPGQVAWPRTAARWQQQILVGLILLIMGAALLYAMRSVSR
ncbi:MAG: hypothetical protein AAF525_21945, partial [Pseudomonadota bacterium]